MQKINKQNSPDINSSMILDKVWRKAALGQDIFTFVDGLKKTVYRDVEGRKTFLVSLAGKRYFVKSHSGIGWKEIFKNILTGKKPILSARTEAEGIRSLSRLGIHTTPLVGFVEQGRNPARIRSLLITQDLGDIVTVESLFKAWQKQASVLPLRRHLLVALAKLTHRMHQHRCYHQDLYLCHFCLDKHFLKQNKLKLYLIDLHRCRILSKANRRAALKDMAAFMFSAMDVGFEAQDWAIFKQHYVAPDADFWQDVEKRAERLYSKFHSAKYQQRLQQERARLSE